MSDPTHSHLPRHPSIPTSVRGRSAPRAVAVLLIGSALVSGMFGGHRTASAQQSILGGSEPGVQYPSEQYYLALSIYRDGDLEGAIEAFEMAMRRTRKDVNGQWIDAIPVYAMLAECYWRVGNLPACQGSLDEAFRIAIRYRGWLGQPDWDSAMRGNVQLAPERGLWPAAASLRRVPLNDKTMFRSGTVLTEQRLAQGGVIEEANIKLIDIPEVMRGLAIAAYRRRILLGPLSDREPLAEGLLEATKYPAGMRHPLGRTLIGAMRAAERFANHEDDRAIEDAGKTTTFGGAIHPLTPIVLLSSASALAATDQPGEAVSVAFQAANAAAALGQPEWVGEAMQLAAGCAGEEGATSVRQAADVAAQSIARDRVSRLAAAHCSVAAADAAISAGQLGDAAQFLTAAQAVTSRRRVVQPRLHAYWGLTSARLAAARGESTGEGVPQGIETGVAIFDTFALNSRFRGRPIPSVPGLYQMELLRSSGDNALGGNRGEELLEYYLKDPPPAVWRRDPVDAMARVVADRSAVESAWVGKALQRTDGEEVIRRVNHVLGSRFLRQLPLAGRLVQLRRLASAEEEGLPEAAKTFVNKPPREFPPLRQAVAQPDPEDPSARSSKAIGLEAITWHVALGRNDIPRTMPPALPDRDVAELLPPRAAMLTYYFAGNQLYGMVSSEGKTEIWQVAGAARLPRDLSGLLRSIGVGKTRRDRLPKNDGWKGDAANLRAMLIPEEAGIDPTRIDELVIVPDGPLWYLPWEALPIGDADGEMIGEALRVRYAATPGLAVIPVAEESDRATVGVVSRSFFAPRDRDADEKAVEAMMEGVDDAVRLPGDDPVPGGLLGGSIGHLVVAVAQTPNSDRPLAFSVAAYDASVSGGTLSAWIRFPAAAPQSVVLAGFRTPADVGRLGNGRELFVTLCGLQAAGVRDVFISRWAVGGQSTASLMRELIQELPFTGMSEAWHRSRDLLRQGEIDPATEPLLSKSEQKREGITGNQPLFWAGYLFASPFEPSSPDPEN